MPCKDPTLVACRYYHVLHYGPTFFFLALKVIGRFHLSYSLSSSMFKDDSMLLPDDRGETIDSARFFYVSWDARADRLMTASDVIVLIDVKKDLNGCTGCSSVRPSTYNS